MLGKRDIELVERLTPLSKSVVFLIVSSFILTGTTTVAVDDRMANGEINCGISSVTKQM